TCVDLQLVAPGTGAEPATPPDEGQPEPGTPEGEVPGTPEGETPGETPADDRTGGDDASGEDTSGASSAGEVPSTPLIPAGDGAPTDATGSPGAAPPPDGTVSMNTGEPVGAAPGVGVPQPLPPLGDPRSESSSSGGCSLPPGRASRSGAFGVGVFALAALLGLRRRHSS